jgi:hypothetical protein
MTYFVGEGCGDAWGVGAPHGSKSMSMLTLDVPSGRAPSKSLWSRLVAFIAMSNRAGADDVLRQQPHLVPAELERVGLGMNSRNESSLPFRR